MEFIYVLYLMLHTNLDANGFGSLAVTVADYANSDPAIVKSGRVKKAVANAIEKEGND